MELKDFIKKEKQKIFKDFTREQLSNIKLIGDIKNQIIAILRCIYDPEISVNIWDLGLIYDIDISLNKIVNIKMTLTSANCPVADVIVLEVKYRIMKVITDVTDVHIEIVWQPQWSKLMMSEEAKFTLDMM